MKDVLQNNSVNEMIFDVQVIIAKTVLTHCLRIRRLLFIKGSILVGNIKRYLTRIMLACVEMFINIKMVRDYMPTLHHFEYYPI